MDDTEQLSKDSYVVAAARAFPPSIFTHWLIFRQKAASYIEPNWQETLPPNRARVRFLDRAAKLWAIFS